MSRNHALFRELLSHPVSKIKLSQRLPARVAGTNRAAGGLAGIASNTTLNALAHRYVPRLRIAVRLVDGCLKQLQRGRLAVGEFGEFGEHLHRLGLRRSVLQGLLHRCGRVWDVVEELRLIEFEEKGT